MKVLDVLRKAGLITTDAAEARAPGDPKTPNVPGIQGRAAATGPGKPGAPAGKGSASGHTVPLPPDEASLAPLGATELIVDFEKIFAALQIPVPPHGWTVEKLARALDSAHFQSLDDATKKAALLAMLEASAAPVADVVDDAIRRDQGLDAYERFARKKLGERVQGIQEKVAQEEARINEAQQAIRDMRESASKEEVAFRSWLDRKISKEQELARVVALLTTEPVISIGEIDRQPPPEGGKGGTEKA